jgi:hypothetical protein
MVSVFLYDNGRASARSFFELEQSYGGEAIQRHITTYVSSNRANIRSSYAMIKIDCQGKFPQMIGSLLASILCGPHGSAKAETVADWIKPLKGELHWWIR